MKTVITIICLLMMEVVRGQDYEKITDLRGRWKFSIGDSKEWADPVYNDQDWESIMVPSSWEDQGFNSYDGFAWYRKNIQISPENAKSKLYLSLGYIDDVDEVYINGRLIGMTGVMPPKYSTAYNALRTYYIPSDIIHFGKNNLLAVRVYDSGLAGGIINGNVGVYRKTNPFPMEIDLQGLWKFRAGDNSEYINPQYNDNNWTSLTVPKTWEDQGYPHMDGFAWYRKKFLVRDFKPHERYVIVLGKIDDLEEVYLNGKYVGPLHKIEDNNVTRYNDLRVYYVSGNMFQNNKYNVISVRVKDNGGVGGIYEGYIGIARQKDYVQYWRSKK